jgi:hypothetical protein
MMEVSVSAQAINQCFQSIVSWVISMKMSLRAIMSPEKCDAVLMNWLHPNLVDFLDDAVVDSQGIVDAANVAKQAMTRVVGAYELAIDTRFTPIIFKTACIEVINAMEATQAYIHKTETYVHLLIEPVTTLAEAAMIGLYRSIDSVDSAELSVQVAEMRGRIRAILPVVSTIRIELCSSLDITDAVLDTLQYSHVIFAEANKQGVLTWHEIYIERNKAFRKFDVPSPDDLRRMKDASDTLHMGMIETFARFVKALRQKRASAE